MIHLQRRETAAPALRFSAPAAVGLERHGNGRGTDLIAAGIYRHVASLKIHGMPGHSAVDGTLQAEPTGNARPEVRQRRRLHVQPQMTIRRSDAAFAMNLIFSKRLIQIQLLPRRRPPSGRRRRWPAGRPPWGRPHGTAGPGPANPLAPPVEPE